MDLSSIIFDYFIGLEYVIKWQWKFLYILQLRYVIAFDIIEVRRCKGGEGDGILWYKALWCVPLPSLADIVQSGRIGQSKHIMRTG